MVWEIRIPKKLKRFLWSFEAPQRFFNIPSWSRPNTLIVNIKTLLPTSSHMYCQLYTDTLFVLRRIYSFLTTINTIKEWAKLKKMFFCSNHVGLIKMQQNGMQSGKTMRFGSAKAKSILPAELSFILCRNSGALCSVLLTCGDMGVVALWQNDLSWKTD